MTDYFFLASSLPSLRIEEKPEITFSELEVLLYDNLLPWDYNQTKILRRFYDILNIRSFWKGEPLDPHGNLNEEQLEEALSTGEGLPPYLVQFLDKYKTNEERLTYFSSLISLYFQNEIPVSCSFLKKYLNFERNLQLVLVGFRAKKLKRNLEKELQFEDPNDDLIAQILAQKDADQFEPPDGFEALRALFERNQENPIKLYQALCEYRFEKIKEMVGSDPFSFSRILGYMARLIIDENLMGLDEQKGLEKIDLILKKSKDL